MKKKLKISLVFDKILNGKKNKIVLFFDYHLGLN